jgi:hypothetical protein
MKACVSIATLVTDRHPQINKWVRENLEDTLHMFDIWHVAKGKCGARYERFDDELL